MVHHHISSILILLSVFWFGCYSNRQSINQDAKRAFPVISIAPAIESSIDGLWVVDSCFTADSTVIKSITDKFGYHTVGLSIKDSSVLIDKNHILIELSKSNVKIYLLGNNDTACVFQGLFSVDEQTKRINYFYVPKSVNLQRYLFKFDEKSLQRYSYINIHNCQENNCPDDYVGFFATSL